jgi:phosphatidylglycerol:prolipoprotein diacylglycerol transferase
MQPILFRIPNNPNGLPVYGFGLMLFVTFIATTWMASRRAVKAGIAREVIQDVAVWIFIGGILGARLTYLIFHQKLTDPVEILKALPKIWDGGIILYGAVTGAVAAYFVGHWLFFRHKPNVTVLRMADVIAPTVALGLIFGRMGCLLNGCCYGQVACENGCPSVTFPLSAPSASTLVRSGAQTACGFLVDYPGPALVTHVQMDSPAEQSGLRPGDVIIGMNGQEVRDAHDIWAVLDDHKVSRDQKADITLTVDERIVPQFPIFVEKKGEPVHLPTFQPRTLGLQPTQVYESISMALLLFLLLAFEPFKRHDGQVMGLMMIGYAAHRYVNEILRSDERPVGLESNVSVFLLAAGLGLMVWLWWRARQAPPVVRQAHAAPVKAAAGTV